MSQEIAFKEHTDQVDHETHYNRMLDESAQCETPHYEYMIYRGDQNPRKGRKGGDCNRAQCQKTGASSWNNGSLSWYCAACAKMLNDANGLFQGEPMVQELPDYHHPYEGNASESPQLAEPKTNLPLSGKRKTKQIKRPVTYLKEVKSSRVKVGRNEPCPCGSGLKYKRCHAT
jgi:hypothetical protein